MKALWWGEGGVGAGRGRVAWVVPARGVGIVRAADGVEVGALDQPRIATHRLLVDGLAAGLVVFMPVDPLQCHRHAIEQQLLTGDASRARPKPAAFPFERYARGEAQPTGSQLRCAMVV